MAISINHLWKDRKRYFGLPLSFTRYALSEDRLFLSVGFLNIKDDEILLYRIRDINTSRNLWQRIFGVGIKRESPVSEYRSRQGIMSSYQPTVR